jgi:hypothetical protein
MRARGILTAVLAAGVLFLAPGIDSARADQNHRHGQPQTFQGRGHAYGWHGQQLFGDRRDGGQAYGQRARTYYGGGLSHQDRQRLKRIRSRFGNERAFNHYLRHQKPGLFRRYMAHNQQRHWQHWHANPQRHVWYRGQSFQPR